MKSLKPRRLKLRLASAALWLLLLPGCIGVYKIDIQQGNEITAEMLQQLELGMSRREVSKTLGFPLINDPFHTDRWDYYFYLKKGSTGKIQQHAATLYFTEDELTDIESSLLDEGADDSGGDGQ